MYYFLKKIKFHFQSQTSHGLHSPFVFDLYNQVLNPLLKNKFDTQIAIKALEKHFQCPSEYFKKEIKQNGRLILIIDKNNIDSFQMELIENPHKFKKCIAIIEQLHNHIETNWENLKVSKEVTFSIDIFEMGLLTFEKIAPKQDFKLRKLS